MAQDRVAITSGRWGVGESVLAWTASVFLGTMIFVAVLSAGDYQAFGPERPGGYLGRTLGQLANGDTPSNDALPLIGQMLLLIPGWLILLGVSWVAAGALGHGRPGWSLKGKTSDVPIGIVAGLLLQVPVMVVVARIMFQILGDFSPSGRALALIDSITSPVALILLVLAVGVGAPVVEELFYRGVLQGALVEKFGPVVGITLASIVFGAVHMSLIEFAPLAIAGAGFGFLAWKFDRLLPAIVAHMSFNMFTLTILLASAQ